jgi:ABC-type sugar transport system permease subunit
VLAGIQIPIGLNNFARFPKPALQAAGPHHFLELRFRILSVAMTFALGLLVAVIFNDRSLPGRKLITTLLLIPYTIPSLITIMVWRGMLNPNWNRESHARSLIGWAPPGLQTRSGPRRRSSWSTCGWDSVLHADLQRRRRPFRWIRTTPPKSTEPTSGSDFWNITLPLLLAVGPLLVARSCSTSTTSTSSSCSLRAGRRSPGHSTEAGHTDILISCV